MQCHLAFQKISFSHCEVFDSLYQLQRSTSDLSDQIDEVLNNLSQLQTPWFWFSKSKKQQIKTKKSNLESQLRTLEIKFEKEHEIEQKIFNVSYMLRKKFSVGNLAALPGAIEESFANNDRNEQMLKRLGANDKEHLLRMVEDVRNYMNRPPKHSND